MASRSGSRSGTRSPTKSVAFDATGGAASTGKQRGIYTDFGAAGSELGGPSTAPRPGTSSGATPSALSFKAVRGSRSRATHAAAEEDQRRKAEARAKGSAARPGGGGGGGSASTASLEPKVFVPHVRAKGASVPPRKVEVERKKRYFASQDIGALLEAEGVDFSELSGRSTESYTGELPLEAFDDTGFEVREPAEWIRLGTEGVQDKASVGVPCKALVAPTKGGGNWAPARAVDYDEASGMFMVEWADGSDAVERPRLHVLFDSEDPFSFARRVRVAFESRRKAEKLLRYNLYIDCMPTEDTPQLDAEQVNRVMASTMSTRALKAASVEATALLTEVNIDYARTMNKIIFDLNLEQMDSGEDSAKMVFDMPEREPPPPPPQFGVIRVPPHNFVDHFSAFAFNSFLTKLEAVHAIVKVRTECNRLLSLADSGASGGVLTSVTKTSRLDEYEHAQTTAINGFAQMMRENWTVNIKNHIVSSLKDVGKGWFNLQETNREVYEFSKLFKFLRVVNFMMQDSLRFYLERALAQHCAFIENACLASVQVVSPKDVTLSFPDDAPPGRARQRPLFVAALQITHTLKTKMVKPKVREEEGDEEGGTREEPPEEEVEYDDLGFAGTVEPDAHVSTPLALFDKALQATSGVTQVERMVMSRLFWPYEPVLETVHDSEPWVVALRDRIERALTRATAPLTEYVATFDEHLPFLKLDVDDMMDDIQWDNRETLDLAGLMKKASRHEQLAKEMEDAIPVEINIGLFLVKCSEPRSFLSAKHADIAARLRKFIADKSAADALKMCDTFSELKTMLSRHPKTIEELCELKEFMGTVPDKVKELEFNMQKVFEQMDALEGVGYKLEGDVIRNRWTLYGWPQQIANRMAEVSVSIAEQQKEYLIAMQDDQRAYDEHLDSLYSDVARLGQYGDLEQIDTVTKHVARLKKQLYDATEKARVFNSREGLFGEEITEYEKLQKVQKQFDPYAVLWETVGSWLSSHAEWMSGVFSDLDAEAMEKQHSLATKNMHRSVKAFEKLGIQGCVDVATTIKKQVADFAPIIPLVIALRNPGMRDRHWEDLSAVLKFEVKPDDNFTLTNVFELNLIDHLDAITKVGERAGKEYQIETALNTMEEAWGAVDMEIEPYRETGTFILRGVDDLLTLLDEHVTMTQAMSFSAFKKPFAERIDSWGATLNTVSEVLEEWIKVQRSWLYLQPIFDSADIQRQLPTEYKRFSTVDKNWRNTLSSAHSKPRCIKFCDNESLLKKFQESNKFLDLVQKGLSDYLETKRAAFARFYFLSNDELLEILSQTKDPLAVQPHLKKCFEGIRKVTFTEDAEITHLISAEGEKVELCTPVVPGKQSVETWMTELEDGMRIMTRDIYYRSFNDYLERSRTEWIATWPGQIVLNASQLHWTREIEEGLEKKGNKGVWDCYEQQLSQLADMVEMVRGKLAKLARITLGALCVVDVHARDVTKKLAQNGVKTVRDFDWIAQMRYYWEGTQEDGDLWVMMVSSKRPYGYEYIGNSWRLVITPLTDKCYLTLMGALQMCLGGAPAGPAGTGKTETVKDLAKALAKQCVVFNCSDGLDYLAMGKFFKGLASCGAWACFDEFNRIDVEVLSVVAQQIMTLQHGVVAGMDTIFFEDSNIKLDGQFAVYITMNPGYAGRTELPDNLKALFRPVAMMVPDYALIGEIMLYSFGFQKALTCAQKMVATFTLCSEQLSSQDHYDYGMRAVKTVITAAGNLKRADPDMDEEVLLLRALQDVNLPKFLSHDLPLFQGIMSDLFPGLQRPSIDYGALEAALRFCTSDRGLQPIPIFLTKCIQLYETIVVRHGLMTVGPTGGAKTSILYVLQQALSLLKAKRYKGHKYEKTFIKTINPKAITMGQLYGEFDANTHEWQDGVLADTIRLCAKSTTENLYWVVFDGPVDALWIENMNTVLDDNKKLCLVSGEIIALSDYMNIIFEVEDLAVASPATVSRCGMVYTEPTSLGVDPLVQSWLDSIPEEVPEIARTELRRLFDTYLDSTLYMLRRNVTEPVPSVDNNLVQSLCRLLDCYLEPFQIVEGRDPPTDEEKHALGQNIEAMFCFCFFWSVAATGDSLGRSKFDHFLRAEMVNNGVRIPLPETGSVYDYLFDAESQKWVPWMETVDPYVYNSKLSFAELIIPTKDSVRYKYLAKLLLTHGKNVLMSGPTGTGKTVNLNELLASQMPQQYIPVTITFSAQTSANQTQDTIDSKLEKRARGVYGPVAGSKYILFVDDLNMPQREKYFAQPPIELLRQWCDHKGWYDRKERVFRRVIDCILMTALGPPGGGRNPVTPRFFRHFNMINYTEMDDESMTLIFGTILGNFFSSFDESIRPTAEPLVAASVGVYSTIINDLLPTPTKPHYTFNLRDLGKVVQGVLMAHPRRVADAPSMCRMWIHECLRVYSDRLVNDADREWFMDLIKREAKTHLSEFGDWEAIRGTQERVIYGDFMIMGADPKIYEEVADISQLQPTVEEYLADFNAESKTPMNLVMFLDAIGHVARISRVIRQPQGNALLMGVGGSGRQSLTRLATFMADYELFQIELTKGYGKNEFREDMKNCLMGAGIEEKQMVFLITDSQIVFEGMLEDINNVLNTGDVPNLYGPEELDTIMNTCRRDCMAKRIQPTKINIFAQYIMRVRKNIHVVFCMSPMSEAFRDRLRMFPSLVNCCTIDWFSEWPDEALQSVAMASLTEQDLGLGEHVANVVEFFKMVHQGVASSSIEFYERLRRRNYVTPTSYLELLSTFKSVLQSKRAEVGESRDRFQIGLDKLISTADQVAKLQEELRDMEPKLIATQKEVEEMLVVITKDKGEAAETKVVVEGEEKVATKLAEETKAIADDAQRDLDEALPALDAAVACLNKLKKSDIDEVRAMKKPPKGVVLTMHATCIMFGIKPVMKKDEENLGKKIKDYWEAATKSILTDANKLLRDLKGYDKDNIAEKIIAEIAPFMDNPDFTVEMVDKSSKACSGICMWVRAMYKYYTVAKEVEPKKKKLAEAQASLDDTMAKLNDAKARLKSVEDRLADLESQLAKATARKEQLTIDVEQCRSRLVRAQSLIGGLGGERTRWTQEVADLKQRFVNLTGDSLVASSTIAYLGAFTTEFRQSLVTSWLKFMADKELPHSAACSLTSVLGNALEIQKWTSPSIGLPADANSIENGIIISKARRWPLMIDPQKQANSFVKRLAEREAENGYDVIRQSEKNFLRALENGVRFGKWIVLENISEYLDAALEPILLQQKFKQGGTEMIRLGDSTIAYNDSFRFFMTTTLPNPHYPPEVAVKVSLLNFTITPSGLEDQMLGVFVETEMPELAERKNSLVEAMNRMNEEKSGIESKILYMLSNSKGNILDDVELIETLSQSKKTSEEIAVKMGEAAETEKEIDTTREAYRPVATRASILYFCIADLSNVDPMYQYAMGWFADLFRGAIENSEQNPDPAARIPILNEYFTYVMYRNVCRSLFERHKLMYSFLLTTKILGDKVDQLEYKFLISGIAPGTTEIEQPSLEWLTSLMWTEITHMDTLPAFKGFAADFANHQDAWQKYFDSANTHEHPLPGKWNDSLDMLEKMCVLRCFRPDKLMMAVQDYVAASLGSKFIEPPPFDLSACFEDSNVKSPLIFVLTQGSDPTKAFYDFAESIGVRNRVKGISLGQGQGVKAARLIEEAQQNGNWVLLQNCHLCSSWMGDLERIVEETEKRTTEISKDYRLWLTSMPSKTFPVSVLQAGVKMTNEPPKGLRQNLKNYYFTLSDDVLNSTDKPKLFQKLLFGLAFFHANVQERKKFGPLGWNVPYEFNESDLEISRKQLEIFLNEYDEVPYKVLNFLTSYINYGGRVTDDKDLRTIDVILLDYFCPEAMEPGYKFSESGLYHTIDADPETPHASYMEYLDTLPLNPDPEVFGMHANANITCDNNETIDTFAIVLSLQPRASGGGGKSREELIAEMAQSILRDLPDVLDVEQIQMMYPVKYEESMNTVLVQECIRYNKLLVVMHRTLVDIQKALKGLVVMSSELEDMGDAMATQRVPGIWEAQCYPSLKPLAAWTVELLQRLNFLTTWIDEGIPQSFWISGFYFPQAFLTGTLQNYARKHQVAIDTLSFDFNILKVSGREAKRPEEGCIIYGLFLEGARFDIDTMVVAPSKPKQLYTELPGIHLNPRENRVKPDNHIYRCPVYKVLSRHGTLSTTGHSTNFVFWIELPSDKEAIINNILLKDTDVWIKAGVAAFCSLRY